MAQEADAAEPSPEPEPVAVGGLLEELAELRREMAQGRLDAAKSRRARIEWGCYCLLFSEVSLAEWRACGGYSLEELRWRHLTEGRELEPPLPPELATDEEALQPPQ